RGRWWRRSRWCWPASGGSGCSSGGCAVASARRGGRDGSCRALPSRSGALGLLHLFHVVAQYLAFPLGVGQAFLQLAGAFGERVGAPPEQVDGALVAQPEADHQQNEYAGGAGCDDEKVVCVEIHAVCPLLKGPPPHV